MKTADLCDQYHKQLRICKTKFMIFGKKKSFSGPIATVRVKNDNVLVKEALKSVDSGTLLVVDGGGSSNCALLGDNLASIAIERNLAGIIIYGCIRDSVEINKMNIGIRALGTMPLKSEKHGKGSRNEVLVFGDVTWVPGEYAYIDQDGIVISKEPLLVKGEIK